LLAVDLAVILVATVLLVVAAVLGVLLVLRLERASTRIEGRSRRLEVGGLRIANVKILLRLLGEVLVVCRFVRQQLMQ